MIKVVTSAGLHFWSHHTSHCTEKEVSVHLRAGSASAERVGQGEMGEVVCCTWWLLGLAVKATWLGSGGPILALTASWLHGQAKKNTMPTS